MLRIPHFLKTPGVWLVHEASPGRILPGALEIPGANRFPTFRHPSRHTYHLRLAPLLHIAKWKCPVLPVSPQPPRPRAEPGIFLQTLLGFFTFIPRNFHHPSSRLSYLCDSFLYHISFAVHLYRGAAHLYRLQFEFRL